MGQFDFSYKFPVDFDGRMRQLLSQLGSKALADAFRSCRYEYEDLGRAYYAGMRGDNWDKNALDFTIEGPDSSITALRRNEAIVEDAISKALRPSKTGFLVRNVLFLIDEDVAPLPVSDEARLTADRAVSGAVLRDLLSACEHLCTNAHYGQGAPEDSVNDFMRSMLAMGGYTELKDQTRHGVSPSGKGAGEVDLLVSKDGDEVALIECLKLASVDTTSIDRHIDKAIGAYNPLGTPTFVLAYVAAADFEGFWHRCFAHLQLYISSLKTIRALQQEASPNAATRIASATLSRDGFSFPFYFLAVKLQR